MQYLVEILIHIFSWKYFITLANDLYFVKACPLICRRSAPVNIFIVKYNALIYMYSVYVCKWFLNVFECIYGHMHKWYINYKPVLHALKPEHKAARSLIIGLKSLVSAGSCNSVKWAAITSSYQGRNY